MEARMVMVVKVLEECKISPPASVPTTSLPLTSYDFPCLVIHPTERLFFYELHDSTKNHFMNTILPKIKHSLSLTLQHFYILAGNLTWPQESTRPECTYNEGDAVSFTVAESDYDFCVISGNQAKDVKVLYPLVPKFTTSCSETQLVSVPVLAIQVTLFPNKGICIGVTLSHAVADGRTASHFMKSWASICRSECDDLLPLPSYDRSITDDAYYGKLKLQFEILGITRDNIFHISLNKDHVVPVDKVQATFVMTSSDIKKLKECLSTQLNNDAGVMEEVEARQRLLHLSSLAVTCAYAWVCLIKARWGDGGITTDKGALEYFIVPADARARQDPPLPITYFGNCLYIADVMAKRSDLVGKDGIAIAAKLIGREIQNLEDNTRKEISYYMSLPPKQMVTLADSPKFAVYDTDFGWGNPKKVDMTSIRESVFITECPSEQGGLQIELVRTKMEMEAFADLFQNSLSAFSSPMDS